MRKYTKKYVAVAILVVLLLVITVSVASASGGTRHRVHYGETLYSIGRQYNINPYVIADVNGLYNPHHIYAGQVLFIPTYYPQGGYHDSRVRVEPYGRHDGYGHGARHHRVVWGETLSGIAYRYGVSPRAIAKVNHIRNPHCIYAGQVLYIPTSGRISYYY